jgi:hypothetical protein
MTRNHTFGCGTACSSEFWYRHAKHFATTLRTALLP